MGKKVIMFRITFSLLLSLIIIFVGYIYVKDIDNEKKKMNLIKEEYYQRMMGENNSKFSVIQTHLNYIKTDDKFISFVGDGEPNYYEITVLQKEFKKTGTLFASLGYSVAVSNFVDDIVISLKNTSPKTEYIKNLNLGISYEKLMENLKKMEQSDLHAEENEESVILFIRDKELKFGKSFFWIIKLDKVKFFNHFDRDKGDWYFNGGNKRIDVSQDSSDIYIVDQGKLSAMDFFKGEFTLERMKFLEIKWWKKTPRYFFILLILSFFTYVFSKKLLDFFYRPLDGLAAEIGNGDSDIDSLEYIRNIHTKLNDRNKNLEAQIESTSKIIEKKKIKDFILGIGETGKVYFQEKQYCVATLEFLENENLERFYSKEVVMGIKTELENTLNQMFNGVFIEIDHKTISYISLSSPKIKDKYEEIIKKVEKEMGISIIAGYIDNVPTKEIPEAYNETLKLMDFTFIYKNSAVINRDELQEFKDMTYYYPVKVEAQLITKIVNEDFKGARKILKDILEENFIRRSLVRGQKQEFLFILINSFKRIISRLTIKGIDVEIELHKISESISYNELEENCFEILSVLREKIKATDEKKGLDIREELIGYIEKNYSEDITLDTLADHMGHSLKYTSYLFKKVIGENFKYTLNKHRVEMAKNYMIKNPELKIKDISKLVGFNSDSTFIRIFKKYEGVSPGRFY